MTKFLFIIVVISTLTLLLARSINSLDIVVNPNIETGPVANVMLPVSRVDQPAVSLPLTSATESRPSLSEKNISIEVYPRVLKQGTSH